MAIHIIHVHIYYSLDFQHYCTQFIIVGVVKEAPVYSKLQGNQIRLLDVIETVNDTPCHKLFLPNMDLQERFEHSIEERDRVKLVLNSCIALPPISSPLSFGRLVLITDCVQKFD